MMNIRADVHSYKLFIRHLRRGLACFIPAAVLLAATSASALIKFDFEQKYFNEPGQSVLDHCVVKKDGVYHLFYLRGNPAVNIGHATTTDFVRWNLEPPVLQPGTWDNNALWAPYLVDFAGNDWYLYYTGVNQRWAQETGMAFSQDLANWIKIPWAVYRPDTAWAIWDETTFSSGRDPHVIEYNGKYYMFVTALTKETRGAIACAESDNLITWTDIGPLYVHENWHALESVFIKYRNNKFHMFFTEELVYGTSHMASDALFSGWDINNRRIIDMGHAPQITDLDGGKEMFSRHSVYNDAHGGLLYTLRFDTLTWVGDLPAPYRPWALAGDWNLIWGNAFPYQPTFRNNPYVRGEDVEDTFVGDCWLGTYERYTGPNGFGFPGDFQGDGRSGLLRSKTFTIQGNSMNLLVGGGNYIDACYVALVDANTSEVWFKETGNNTDEMDRRYWNLRPYKGKQAYIEIADLSTDVFGHINCDDITESLDVIDDNGGDQSVVTTKKKSIDEAAAGDTDLLRPALYQNTPNPFNPTTTLSYDIPRAGRVQLRVFDVSGRLVRNLVDRSQADGRHTIDWDGRSDWGDPVVSGIYFYRLMFDGTVVQTRKMLLIK